MPRGRPKTDKVRYIKGKNGLNSVQVRPYNQRGSQVRRAKQNLWRLLPPRPIKRPYGQRVSATKLAILARKKHHCWSRKKKLIECIYQHCASKS